MPALSFSVVEILPALLDKTKTQTIRPLWKKGETTDYGEKTYIAFAPRLKVGDIVTLYWKQRSSPKGSFFCSKCGTRLRTDKFSEAVKDMYHCEGSFPFEKIIGKGKLTEVFEIKMWSGNDAPLVSGYKLKDTYELARRDGFKPGKEGKYGDFYDYFCSKKYGWLETPKRFAVYRWKWLIEKTGEDAE